MITYIQAIYKKPQHLYIGKNMNKTIYLFLIFFTSLIISLLSLFEIIPSTNKFINEFEEIKKSIPSFEIVDNHIETTADSYIYKTDSLIFYFEGSEQIDEKIIEENINIQNIPVSVGLLNDKIYFNLLGMDYSFLYEDFNDINYNEIVTILNQMNQFNIQRYLLFAFILLIFNLFIFVSQLIPVTLFANIISVYRKTNLKFSETAKIALLSTIGPSILMSLVNLFPFNIYYQLEIVIIFSVLLYYQSISEYKKININKKSC